MKNLGRSKRPLTLAAATVAIAVLLAGCSVTGGGQIPGAVATTASFGFSAVNTGVVHGNAFVTRTDVKGNYQDGYVKLRFTSGDVETFSNSCKYGPFEYTSTNPKPPYSGGGQGNMYMCDYGQPNGAGDTFSISITSGPYSGYANSGPVINGNLRINNQAP